MNIYTTPPRPAASKALRGLVAAAFTPFQHDGSLDCDRIKPMVDFVINQGADGLYVLGSTGEGPSLTSVERMRVAEAFVAATAKRIPVVVQVGHTSIAESRNLAGHAQAIGADGISATPPTYFKPENIDILVACMAEIAAGAPQVPFYYYNLPTITGVRFDMAAFLAKSAGVIPTLRGIKFSDFQLNEMEACVEFADGRYDILFGADEMMLNGFVSGARGAVGTTYNFAAHLYRKIITAFEEGDIQTAAIEQRRAARMIEVICRHAGRGGLKAAMGICGCDCGPNRLPVVSCPRPAMEAIRRELAEIGFFDWINCSGTSNGDTAAQVRTVVASELA